MTRIGFLLSAVLSLAIGHVRPAQAKTIRRTVDVLVIGGTSLVVYPAAGLIDYYQGDKLVLINKDKTSKDNRANLILHEPIGEVLKPLA